MAGKYINKGNRDFAEARTVDYVDKSELIGFVNRTLSTPAKMTCVSRARRFGKSLALQMLYAYYDKSCDSSALFDDLKIHHDDTYSVHRNQYLTIHLDITSFITGAADKTKIVEEMQERVIEDIIYRPAAQSVQKRQYQPSLCRSLYDGYSAYQELWHAICSE